jgi:hypothetical protein
MADDLADEILYGRDHDHARIFISSKMDGSLDAERKHTAAAIDSLKTHKAWWWEVDAPAGVLHSETECIKFAGTSDGLILLVAGELSAIIYSEFAAAEDALAERYIFIRKNDVIPDEVKDFIARKRHSIVTLNFQNMAELQTHVYQSLNRTAVRAMRELQLARRRQRGTKT